MIDIWWRWWWWWIAIAQWVTKTSCWCLFSKQDHIQRFSPSQTSDNPRAGFEPAQNLTSGFVVWRWVVVITSTPLHYIKWANVFSMVFFADFASRNLKVSNKLYESLSKHPDYQLTQWKETKYQNKKHSFQFSIKRVY